ncbi:Peptidase S1/S6 [Aphelenchoides avenae]|nr:Peptidase S1/S6 [Aphelenchus avenae]
MFATATACLLLLAAISVAAKDFFPKCGTTVYTDPPSQRLRRSYGEPVSLDEFPWTVLIQYNLANRRKRDPCVGTLISDRHVLTARECVDAEGPNNRSAQLLQPLETQVRLGKDGGLHNASKINALENVDIAVIEVKR